MLIIGFPEGELQTRQLAAAMSCPFEIVEIHEFPDGESLIRIGGYIDETVVVLRSLDHPNEKLVELKLVHDHLLDNGAKRLTLVAPYLCYMRQDKAFRKGEVVSAGIVPKWLGEEFKEVITVDPHLHRIGKLEDVMGTRVVTLSAATQIGEFVSQHVRNPFIIGPDEESRQWVEEVSAQRGLPFGVAQKVRHGDRDVQVKLPPMSVEGRNVVMVDDIISSGVSVERTAKLLLAKGAASVSCAVTHAIPEEGAIDRIRNAGVANVWSTDSVTHPTNQIRLANTIASVLHHDEVSRIFEKG